MVRLALALLYLPLLSTIAAEEMSLERSLREQRAQSPPSTRTGTVEWLSDSVDASTRLCLSPDRRWAATISPAGTAHRLIDLQVAASELEPEPGDERVRGCARPAAEGARAVTTAGVQHDALALGDAAPRGVDYAPLLEKVGGPQLSMHRELLVQAAQIGARTGDDRLATLVRGPLAAVGVRERVTRVRLEELQTAPGAEWATARASVTIDANEPRAARILIPLQRGGLSALPIADGAIGDAIWEGPDRLIFIASGRLWRLSLQPRGIAASFAEVELDARSRHLLALPPGWIERLRARLDAELDPPRTIVDADADALTLDDGLRIYPVGLQGPANWLGDYVGRTAEIELPEGDRFDLGYRPEPAGEYRFEEREVGALPARIRVGGDELHLLAQCANVAAEMPIQAETARLFGFEPPLPDALADDPPDLARCTARLTVDAEGNVEQVDLLGCIPRRAELEWPAESALRQWRYEPLFEDDCPRRHARVEAIEFGG